MQVLVMPQRYTVTQKKFEPKAAARWEKEHGKKESEYVHVLGGGERTAGRTDVSKKYIELRGINCSSQSCA